MRMPGATAAVTAASAAAGFRIADEELDIRTAGLEKAQLVLPD
jgi:hypothetical protein